jgi:hypothetical protein
MASFGLLACLTVCLLTVKTVSRWVPRACPWWGSKGAKPLSERSEVPRLMNSHSGAIATSLLARLLTLDFGVWNWELGVRS